MSIEMPSRNAWLQRAVLRRLLAYPAHQYVSPTLLSADMACERSPATLGQVFQSMRRWTESKKGRGGGYRLKAPVRKLLEVS